VKRGSHNAPPIEDANLEFSDLHAPCQSVFRAEAVERRVSPQLIVQNTAMHGTLKHRAHQSAANVRTPGLLVRQRPVSTRRDGSASGPKAGSHPIGSFGSCVF
jgi:hypothetical protein